MKNIVNSVIDALRVATGRKITQEQMKKAIPQNCTMDFEHYLAFTDVKDNISKKRKKVSEIHKYTDNKFAFFTSTFGYALNVKKAIKREYNEQGLLTRKIIDYYPQTFAQWITILYSPPGSFFGKIDRERSTN